jgi:hypothetical protein
MRPATAMVLTLALAALTLPDDTASAELDRADMTTRAVIEEAHRTGLIDGTEMILGMAYTIYAPWKLPAELRGGKIDKCGTAIADEIERALPGLPAHVADEIRRLRARPTCDEYVDTAHFRIHYDTSGLHEILSEAYLDSITVAAEHAWACLIDDLGFREPPADGSDPDGGGGSDRYDVYVQNLVGLYGYCQGAYTVPDTPLTDCTSYVVIENDYAGFGYPDPADPMKVTVVHEFCHACQNAHDYTEEVWYKECTSVWAEDYCYDDIDDYIQYLSYFLNSPYRSLGSDDASGLRIYGSCIWNHWLAEYYEPECVVAMWYAAEGSIPILSVFHSVLNGSYGSSLEEALGWFAVWNFFTGFRDDGGHYEEGGSWPAVTMQRTYSSYPIVDGAPYEPHRPDAAGANYIQFTNPSPGGEWPGLNIVYDGPWVGTVPSFAYVNYQADGGGTAEYGEVALNMAGNGVVSVDGWDSMSYACLVVANLTTNVNDMEYTYDVHQVSPADTDTVSSHVFALRPARPNPFRESTSIPFTVPNAGGAVDVTIYDVAGRKVREIVCDEWMDAGDCAATWDAFDEAGQPVCSGVYMVRLSIDGVAASEKLVVVR